MNNAIVTLSSFAILIGLLIVSSSIYKQLKKRKQIWLGKLILGFIGLFALGAAGWFIFSAPPIEDSYSIQILNQVISIILSGAVLLGLRWGALRLGKIKAVICGGVIGLSFGLWFAWGASLLNILSIATLLALFGVFFGTLLANPHTRMGVSGGPGSRTSSGGKSGGGGAGGSW